MQQYPISKNVYRLDMVNWIMASGCTHAMTLALNKECSLTGGYQRAGKFLKELDRKSLGKRFYSKPIEKRTHGFVIPEHLNSNLHFHLALKLEGQLKDKSRAELCAFLSHAWGLQTAFSGSIEYEEVYSLKGWARYITKESYRNRFEYKLAADYMPNDKF